MFSLFTVGNTVRSDDDWVRQEELRYFFACSRTKVFETYLRDSRFPARVAIGPIRYRLGDLRAFRKLLEEDPQYSRIDMVLRRDRKIMTGGEESLREHREASANISGQQGLASLKAKLLVELHRLAKTGFVISFYELASRLKNSNVEVSLTALIKMLDEWDRERFRSDGVLPSVLIHDCGKPLRSTREVASSLKLILDDAIVMDFREKLFKGTLAETDPKPICIRWFETVPRMMMPCYLVRTRKSERHGRARTIEPPKRASLA